MSGTPPSSDTVTFKIDGQEVTVPKGTTVMAAAKKINADIPHFCWHPGLSVAGVCRFCMVKVEGRPKLEIACNLTATPGMDVKTNIPEVKDAHKWGLEFHLINHPLDCPICDQAGECGLQDFYMSVGKYESQMTRPKVLKPKALEVGKELVLDTERCILCSRCVRFEEEVTKTDALGIFDRGDRAIVGTYPGKKLEHNYQANLVDICPVGAFTSKDFRFRQRVWFLKDRPAVCPGCSTGCTVNVFGKPETGKYYRIKPRESDVNGYWMCDTGRHMYTHMAPEERLRAAFHTDAAGRRVESGTGDAVAALATKLAATPAADVALLVSAQYTNEEYTAFFDYFVKKLGVKNVFQWRDPAEKRDAFDGLLYRGDKNANTAGLMAAMKAAGLAGDIRNQFDDVIKARPKLLIALTPEIPSTMPSLSADFAKLAALDCVSFWTINGNAADLKGAHTAIPMKGFAEKRGNFTNFAGKLGALTHPFSCMLDDARDVGELVDDLSFAMSDAASAPHRDGKSSGQNYSGLNQ